MPTNPSFGPTGLVTLRTAEVRENMVEALQGSAEWGPQAQTGADHALGQLIDIPADQIGLVYELVQGNYDAWAVGTAEGVWLDNLVSLLGLTRNAATYSTVTLTLTGTPSATIPAPRQARVLDGPTFIFTTDVTLDVGGSGTVTALAVESGAVEALAGTITVIVDTHPDWSAVTNAADAVPGSPIETDAELRARREADLARAGRCTDRSLRAALQDIDTIEAAVVISNRTLGTVDGIPGKEFEAVIWPDTGYDATAVATAVWQHTPNGIQSHGDESATVTDNQGVSQTVYWSHADEIAIHWEINVTKDTEAAVAYPGNGNDLVRDCVLAYMNTLTVSNDVLPDQCNAVIIGGIPDVIDGVPGIRDLDIRLKAGGAPGPGDTSPIDISSRQIATTDSGDVDVNS